MAIIETRLRPGGEHDLKAQDYSRFRMDRADGGIVAERFDAREGHKQRTPNIQILEVNNATGSSRISAAAVYRGPSLTPSDDGELALFSRCGYRVCEQFSRAGRFSLP